jgi:hypothetical protein
MDALKANWILTMAFLLTWDRFQSACKFSLYLAQVVVPSSYAAQGSRKFGKFVYLAANICRDIMFFMENTMEPEL